MFWGIMLGTKVPEDCETGKKKTRVIVVGRREEKSERREDMLVHLTTLSELRRGVNEM